MLMMYRYSKKETVKAPIIPVAIIVALLAAAASVTSAGIAYKATTYRARAEDAKITAGYTEKIRYGKSSSPKSATFTATPPKGTMYINILQKKGDIRTGYSVRWKAASNASYKDVCTVRISNNNFWMGEKKCGGVKNAKHYNICIIKKDHTKTASSIEADWLIK